MYRYQRKAFFSRGLTMIEILMALSFISAILSSIFILDNVRVGMEIRNVINIISTVKDAYRSIHNYSTLNNLSAAHRKIIPEKMIKGTYNNTPILQNSWGGDVNIGPNRMWYPNDSAQLTYNDVPASACLNLLAATAKIAEAVSVNGVIVKNETGTPSVRFNVQKGSEACQANKYITIAWKVL